MGAGPGKEEVSLTGTRRRLQPLAPAGRLERGPVTHMSLSTETAQAAWRHPRRPDNKVGGAAGSAAAARCGNDGSITACEGGKTVLLAMTVSLSALSLARRREFLGALGGAAAWPLAAQGQQPAIPVIGFLGTTTPKLYAYVLTAFRQRDFKA
jgi:hypothetical protein